VQENLLEAATGVEPVMEVLQSVSRADAGPYVAIYFRESISRRGAESPLSRIFFPTRPLKWRDFLK
jgi:hypothetical protein